MSCYPYSERLQKVTIDALCSTLEKIPHELPESILPDDIFTSLYQSLDKIIDNPAYSIPAFKANKVNYNGEEAVIIGVISLIKSLNSSVSKLKTDLQIAKDEIKQKDSEIEEITNRFESVVDEIKILQAKEAENFDKIQLTKQLEDATERISLMQSVLQRTQKEKEELVEKLDSETLRTTQLDEELQQSQSMINESQVMITSLNDISQALGYQNAETSDEVLSQIKELLNMPHNSDNIRETVYGLIDSNTQYRNLLRVFNLNINTSNKEEAIRKACEENAIYNFKLQHSLQTEAQTCEELFSFILEKNQSSYNIEEFKCFSLEPETKNMQNQLTQTNKMETNVDDNTSILAFQTNLATSYKQQNEELKKNLEDASELATTLKNTQRKYKSVKSQRDELNFTVSQLKSQIEAEQKKNEESENNLSKKKEECVELQSQIDELNHINTALKETIAIKEEESSNDNSAQRISDAFTMALNEIQEQGNELSQLTQQKAQCVKLLDKQMRLIDSYDSQLQFALIDKENAKAKEEEPIERFTDDDIFDLITSITLDNVEDSIENITNIAKSDDKPLNKLKKMLESLLNDVIKAKNEDGPNTQKVLKLLNDQLMYIDAFTKNGNIPDNIRTQLIENVKESHEFLEKYASGLIEEFSLFNLLDTDEDPEELQESVQKLFDNYPELETEQSNEIFISLRQSIAVISLLRKFCSTTQMQCTQLRSEIERLKEELNSANTKLDDEKTLRDEAFNDKGKLEKVINAVQVAVSTRNIDTDLATEIEGLCNGNTIADDYAVQRIRELESNLNQTNLELEEMQNDEIEKSNKIIADQKTLIEQKDKELESQGKSIKEVQKEFMKVKEASEDLKKDYISLEKKYNNVRQKLETERRENAVLAAQAAQQKGSLQAQIDSLANDIKQRDETDNAAAKEKISKLQSELKKSKAKCEELEHSAELTKKKLNSTREESTQKHTDLIRSKEEIRKLKEMIAALEIENNILKSKNGLIEKRFNQQMKQFKDATSVENSAKEAGYRAEKARIIEEKEKQRSKFLLDLTTLLRKKVDITKKFDENYAIDIISATLRSEDDALQELERLHELERQNIAIRQLLKAKEGERTVSLVQFLINSK